MPYEQTTKWPCCESKPSVNYAHGLSRTQHRDGNERDTPPRERNEAISTSAPQNQSAVQDCQFFWRAVIYFKKCIVFIVLKTRKLFQMVLLVIVIFIKNEVMFLRWTATINQDVHAGTLLNSSIIRWSRRRRRRRRYHQVPNPDVKFVTDWPHVRPNLT